MVGGGSRPGRWGGGAAAVLGPVGPSRRRPRGLPSAVSSCLLSSCLRCRQRPAAAPPPGAEPAAVGCARPRDGAQLGPAPARGFVWSGGQRPRRGRARPHRARVGWGSPPPPPSPPPSLPTHFTVTLGPSRWQRGRRSGVGVASAGGGSGARRRPALPSRVRRGLTALRQRPAPVSPLAERGSVVVVPPPPAAAASGRPACGSRCPVRAAAVPVDASLLSLPD